MAGLLQNYHKLGLYVTDSSPLRVFLAGDSAGGNLTAAVTMKVTISPKTVLTTKLQT
jgi:acetyl esterase/lipase